MLRVVVELTDLGGVAGWQVALRAWLPGETIDPIPTAPYTMPAMELPDLVGTRRVPIPASDRLPASDQLHHALCAGDATAASELIERLKSRSAEAGDGTLYGRWLFESLLAPRWAAISAHPSVVADRAVEIALSWPADDGDLHRLVWEAMHDSAAPLAAHADFLVAITRLVPIDIPTGDTVTELPRLLFAAGSRLADATIRAGAMYMGLLRAMDSDGRCLARAVQEVSLDSLRAACVQFRPHVVHLVAHGQLVDGDHAVLLLRDKEPAQASDLVKSLSPGGRRPLAVVLSACNTGTAGVAADDALDPVDAWPLAAQLVAGGIPIVSAMAGEVSEPACRLYTKQLVKALLDGQSIVNASAHGRRAALIGAARPTDDIDWALPTVFLAASQDPNLRLMDATEAQRLIDIGRSLDLRHEPVFVGRTAILADADRLLEPDSGIGVMAILSAGSTADMGGTRLLREIGWRLLRAGHVPLLLGPYGTTDCPIDLRGLVAEVLTAAVRLLDYLDLKTFAPIVFGLDAQEHDQNARAALQQRIASAPSAGLGRAAVRSEVVAFRQRTGPLDPAAVLDVLREDLHTLVELVAASGRPFGKNAQAVLLLDDVHAWHDALTDLLKMLTNDGFGKPGQRIPVVMTGSKAENGGKLADWSASESKPGYRKYALDELSAEDKIVGYQWILLHPWESRSSEDEAYKRTYTLGARSSFDLSGLLRGMNKKPKLEIESHLYVLAKGLADANMLQRDDDDQAFNTYAQLHPEYHL